MPWSFTLIGEDQASVLSLVNGELPFLAKSKFGSHGISVTVIPTSHIGLQRN